jgi:nucleoside-diphosphate-sugar epimerase
MPTAAESGGSVPTRKRGSTNKRVSNRRLREELGWSPNFPTWREGYAEAIAGVVSATRRHDDRKASG